MLRIIDKYCDNFCYKWRIFWKRWAFMFIYERSKLGTLIFDVPQLDHIKAANRPSKEK